MKLVVIIKLGEILNGLIKKVSEISEGCFVSKEQNPCLTKITYTHIDRSENETKKVVVKLKIGYETGLVYINGSSTKIEIPIDLWCS